MLATLDNNHLLCIEDTTLDTGKIYQQQFQGYHISEKNKLLFVLHKKEIKLMELKNIGSTMGVFYIDGWQPFQLLRLVPEFVQFAGEHFGGFDEETGERYYFFPFFPPQRMEAMNAICSKLNIPLQLQQSAKGVISAWREANNSPTAANGGTEQLLGHLFGLVLLYGKFERKVWALNSIKIHLPIFWQYLPLQDQVEQTLQQLQQQGIFLQSSLNRQQDKTTLQITSNDYELLQIFSNWYKPVENFTQITKSEQTAQAIQLLKAFVEQGSIENVDEVKRWIDQGTVKILVK